MINNKRGLSTVVTTLIMVLLVLVAIGVVWAVIKNIINEGAEQISLGDFMIDLKIESVKVDNSGNVSVIVKRGAGAGDLYGINLIVSDGTETEIIVRKDINLDEIETRTFTINRNDLGDVGFVKDISIAPIFKTASGTEKPGNAVDGLKLTNKQIIENLGVVSWWRFDGSARDEIGNSDGTLNGGADCGVQGKYNKACDFEGDGNHIDIIDTDGSLNITDAITITAWIKPESNQPNLPNIIRNRDSDDGYIFRLTQNEPRKFYVTFWANGGSVADITGSSNVITDWQYVAVTYDPLNTENLVLYINGGIDAIETGQTDNWNLPSGINLTISSSIATQNYFNGAIDEVMIFDRALSENEIKALYGLDLS